MKVTLNINIELEDVSPAKMLQIKNNLHLHLINQPLNNIDLINEFNLETHRLMIGNIEQVTAGLTEHYTLKIVG